MSMMAFPSMSGQQWTRRTPTSTRKCSAFCRRRWRQAPGGQHPLGRLLRGPQTQQRENGRTEDLRILRTRRERGAKRPHRNERDRPRPHITCTRRARSHYIRQPDPKGLWRESSDKLTTSESSSVSTARQT